MTNEATALQTPRFDRAALLGLVVVVAAVLLLCLPFLRVVYWFGDEGILLRGAAVLAAGGKIYTDFFAFYPPAGYLIMEVWLRVFGPSFLGVRIFATLMIAAIAGFSYLACRLVSGNVILSVFLSLAWLSNTKSTWTVGISHHWLTTTLSMATCWLTLRSMGRTRSGQPALAGLLAGMAAMVTSSCGLWAMLATLASFVTGQPTRRALLACLLGCLAVPLLCLAYIIMNGEFAPAYAGIVRFTLTQYSSIQKVPFGAGMPWGYPLRYIFPLAGLLAMATARSAWRDPRFNSCVLFALSGLLGVFPRPDVVHIGFTAPLALPLVAYAAAWLTVGLKAGARAALLGLALLWCLPAAIGFVHQGVKALRTSSTMTAAGPVALAADGRHGGAEVLSFLSTLPAGANIFFYPYMPLMPFLAQRRQVSRFDVFTPEYTQAAQYFQACEDVTRQAQWVILDRKRMGAAAWLPAFPAMRDANPPETQAFEHALEQNFALVRNVGDFEIRQRDVAASDADCKAIY